MPITSEERTQESQSGPVILYMNRSDIVRVGGASSHLYMEALHDAFIQHAQGNTVQPLKPYLRVNEGKGHIADRIIAMPAHIGGEEAISGLKWIGSKHDNPARHGLERASALIILNDPATNYPLAVLEGGLISGMRTAAITALAARYLAKEQFQAVTCLGCGLIARMHLRVLLEQFPHITTVNLFDLDHMAPQRLVAEIQADFPAVEYRIMATAEEAVRVGEVVVACTVTDTPYVHFDWLSEGAFFSNISLMDVHKEVFLQADKVVVDDWMQCNREKKIINQLTIEGRFSRDQLHAELGEVVSGKRAGRESNSEIILFNPIGIAIADVACARSIYRKALEDQVGTWLQLY